MSNMQAIRKYVMDLYPNPTWHRRVHKMPDNQVYAIYRAKEEEKKYLKENQVPQPQTQPTEQFHQIDIWEYLNYKGGKK